MRRLLVATLTFVGALLVTSPAQAEPPEWTSSIAPTAPGRISTSLIDVACASTRFCIAVAAGAPAVVEIDHGTSTAVALPLPIDRGSARDAHLSAVACSTASWCVAVGSYQTYTGRSRPLLETYRHGRWRATTVVSPAHTLSAVACNRSTCLATGDWYGGYFNDTAMIERDASGTWSNSGLSVAYGNTIGDPACTPGAGPCFAQVFHQTYGYPTARAFAYPSGPGWKLVPFPGPPGADLTTLALGAMSCPQADYCAGVGSYRDAAPPYASHLVAEKLVQGRLSATEIPLPAAVAGMSDDLIPTDTACMRRAQCVAGVSFYDYVDHHDGVLVSSSGSQWTAQVAPVPAGGDPSTVSISDAACSATRGCAAVGRVGSGAEERPLAEDWPGGAWRPTGIDDPAGSSGGGLAAVSCRGVRCTGAGEASGDPLLATSD